MTGGEATLPGRGRGTERWQLDLSRVGDRLRADLSRGGRDAAPLRTSVSQPFDEERVRALQEEMSALLSRASRWGELEGGGQDLLRRHGQLLFDELLPRPVRQALRALGPAELGLVMDASLVFVPWEWMHDGEDFLGLRHALGRMVRTERAPQGRPRGASPSPLRMLVLADPRGDLLGAYYEGVTLRDELDGAATRLRVDLRSTDVTSSEIRQLLRDYDIVHYAGHAEARPDAPEASGWLVKDGVLSAADVLDLAGGPPFPHLVFANACRSGEMDARLVVPDRLEADFSLASAFLLAGVRHVVGTLWDVPDEAACHVAVAFYEALLEGASLGEAMTRARRGLRARYGDDGVLWAAWVLYGDPGVRAIRPPTPARAASAGRPPAPARAVAPPRAAMPQVVRGRRALPRLPLAADPPFERAGAGSRRLLGALGVGTAIALGAVLALLATRPADAPAVELASLGEVPEAATPELVPVARAGAQAAAAESPEAAATVRAAQPTLAALVEEDAAAGRPGAAPLAAGAPLRSWDHFRLRVHAPAAGWIAVWHVESQGRIGRIHPEDDGATASRVEGGATVDLPGEDRWYYLDDRRGTELFLLGFAAAPPLEDAAWQEGLDSLERRLVQARAEAATDPAAGLVLRGLGGTVAPKRAGRAEEPLLDEVLAAFRARYDAVIPLAVEHR